MGCCRCLTSENNSDPSLDEQVLVASCLKGNRESQQQLYERYAPKMLGVCYRYAQSLEEAEDILQEVFITVFRKLGQFRQKAPLGAWIHRITVNTALNCIKSRLPASESLELLEQDAAHATTGAETGQAEKDLMGLVRTLPYGYRTVFNLFAIEGYSHEEIGQLLGIKAASSRSQYARARELMMKKIGSDYPSRKQTGNNG